jgi:hypothetical protein
VTDNYYTTVKLAIHMWVKYGWTIVGTIVSTDKVTRTNHDIPFLKLSQGARMECRRGWFREAVLCVRTSGKELWIQATTWRDKKQVMFLSTNRVGASSGNTVSRRERGEGRRIIDAPNAQQDYVTYFNGVDRTDRDSRDYSTSIRTNRYYLRILLGS